MAAVGYAQGSMPEEEVVAVVRGNFDCAFLPVQAIVVGIGAAGAVVMPADPGGGVAHPPALSAAPEGGDGARVAVRVGDENVERYFIEWVVVELA